MKALLIAMVVALTSSIATAQVEEVVETVPVAESSVFDKGETPYQVIQVGQGVWVRRDLAPRYSKMERNEDWKDLVARVRIHAEFRLKVLVGERSKETAKILRETETLVERAPTVEPKPSPGYVVLGELKIRLRDYDYNTRKLLQEDMNRRMMTYVRVDDEPLPVASEDEENESPSDAEVKLEILAEADLRGVTPKEVITHHKVLESNIALREMAAERKRAREVARRAHRNHEIEGLQKALALPSVKFADTNNLRSLDEKQGW